MPNPNLKLDNQVQFLKGVGPRRASDLSREGILTVEDLLLYLPFRYEDRTSFRKISSLRDGDWAVVFGQVALAGVYRTPVRKMSIFEAVVRDDTGTLILKYFNQPFMRNVIHNGDWLVAYGQVRRDPFKSSYLAMQKPEVEIIENPESKQAHAGRITPIYRRIGSLTGKVIRQIVWDLLAQLDEELPPLVPQKVAAKWKMPERTEAVMRLHAPLEEYSRPEKLGELNEFRSPFHFRLIFEEFFLFQTGVMIAREQKKQRLKGRTLQISDSIRARLKTMLPFHPTEAQKKTLKQIVDDLKGRHPMNRLLQGDVGSGKTIVAAQTAVIAVDNGWQVAMMAPTEILAEQHYQTFRRLVAPLGVETALLTSAVSKKERTAILKSLEAGKVSLVIGTHALIQEKVNFANLGLAIIDEQQRFGVMQRSALMEKGENVDVLIMTATPIPRSLAMVQYGDLDVSVIDQLPPGRKPVRTVLKAETSREEVYNLIYRQVAAGRQAYVVYPLIEESEKIDLRAVKAMGEELRQRFRNFEVGVLHGRMKPPEKEELMEKFSTGEVQILAATTVIEVGIDVPNASLMVIEHAERFGLSQLHQLRGRVGRDARESICVLLVDRVASQEAWERLQIMKETQDGFLIAEKDLEIRGPGEFAGTRQSGVPLFRHGNLVRDRKIMELAREEARLFLQGLSGAERQQYIVNMRQVWKDRFHLSRVG
ncbi:MAG TPA: ATP-dependent DNA helicase RecG [Acidobacteriota bacterium]|jgi:ATP-dependent DNA helicase RecG